MLTTTQPTGCPSSHVSSLYTLHYLLCTDIISSDAENIHFVYEWRQEQEQTLRATKGTGMTEEQVNHFVDGCTSNHLINKKNGDSIERKLTNA